MTDCLFCRIVAGEIASTEVASTELTYAFRDVNPRAPTHVLLVPRRHIDDADALRAEHAPDLVDLVLVAQQVARAEGLIRDGAPAGEQGYRLVFNVGDLAGNTVGHLHLHLLGGRPLAWPPG